MEGHWRTMRQLFRQLQLALVTLKSVNGHFAHEWPRRCSYWAHTNIKRWCRPLFVSDIDGCSYQMRAMFGADRGELLLKQWRVVCSSPIFASGLERRCTRDHEHAHVAGGNTAPSGNYSHELATAIWRHVVALMGVGKGP